MSIDDDDLKETQVDGVEAVRQIQALNDQAREILIFPSMAVNLMADPEAITLAIEFQRVPDTAFDATVVQLNWDQMMMLYKFLRLHVGGRQEATEIRKMFPTNERENRDDFEA